MKKILIALILLGMCVPSFGQSPANMVASWGEPVGWSPSLYEVAVSANGGDWVSMGTTPDTTMSLELTTNVKWRMRARGKAAIEVEQEDGTVQVFEAWGEWSEPSPIHVKPEAGRVGGCLLRNAGG